MLMVCAEQARVEDELAHDIGVLAAHQQCQLRRPLVLKGAAHPLVVRRPPLSLRVK